MSSHYLDRYCAQCQPTDQQANLPTCQQASLDARAEEAALPSRLQHAARLGALAMLVPDLNGCPCCTNPPSYFVTDAATCLLGNPLAHAVRHRVALYGRDTTVWL